MKDPTVCPLTVKVSPQSDFSILRLANLLCAIATAGRSYREIRQILDPAEEVLEWLGISSHDLSRHIERLSRKATSRSVDRVYLHQTDGDGDMVINRVCGCNVGRSAMVYLPTNRRRQMSFHLVDAVVFGQPLPKVRKGKQPADAPISRQVLVFG